MFSSLKSRLLLGVYIFLVISIPVGAYLASQYQTIKSSASETKKVNFPKTAPPVSGSAGSSAKEKLLGAIESNLPVLVTSTPSPSPDEASSSPTIATSFGPTLSLKATLEGRPDNNQADKLFVGLVEGQLSSNPKFLLSFTVDLPSSGEYSNLSLAGLNPGSTYTALLKGDAQIATSSAFTMSPTVSSLNGGRALNMLSGDLNADNTINSSDYSIVLKAFGSKPGSSNWNELADFNKDGVINAFDLAIVSGNLGRTGASGAWTSPIPSATPSAGLNQPPNVGGPTSSGGPSTSSGQGYWMWVPASP